MIVAVIGLVVFVGYGLAGSADGMLVGGALALFGVAIDNNFWR